LVRGTLRQTGKGNCGGDRDFKWSLQRDMEPLVDCFDLNIGRVSQKYRWRIPVIIRDDLPERGRNGWSHPSDWIVVESGLL
jgi:hypothetical protein